MTNEIKRIKEKLKTAQNQERVELLNELGTLLSRSAPEEAEGCAKEALELAEELDFQLGITGAYNVLGISHYIRGDYQKTVEYFADALNICEDLGDKRGVASFYGNIGVVYRNQGDSDKALEYYFKSLKIFEDLELKQNLANTYNNIGLVYRDQLKPDKALEYHFQALELRKELEDESGLGMTYNNIGLDYQDKGNFDEALVYHFRALKIREKIEDKQGIGLTYYNIASIYGKQNELQKALDYYTKGINVVEELGDKANMASYYNNIGHIHTLMEHFDRALDYLNNGLKIAQELGAKSREMECYQFFSELYEMMGDFRKALENHKKYLNLNLVIFNEKSSQQMAEMEAKYETEKAKKEAEIQHLRNVELKNALGELKRTQKQLVESEKMASLGNLVAGVAHEINTPVGISLTASSVIVDKTKSCAQLYQQDKMTPAILEDYLEEVYEAGNLVQKNMERTSHLINSFKQVSVDQSSEQQRAFKPKEYLHDVITTLKPKLKDREITIDIQCDDELVLESFPGVFAQIFTNLILNSIQHGFSDTEFGEISINFHENETGLKIEYQDNGKGIPDDILPNIFEPFFTTNKQRGTGLGLHIVYNLISQKLNGTIECRSDVGKGAVFDIHLPFSERRE